MRATKFLMGVIALFCLMMCGSCQRSSVTEDGLRKGREEVVFWHFWGGKDGEVVDEVVDAFNRSQDRYFVRAIAMPGNNLDTKLFLSIAGGDPPDLVNQDDPIVADWAHRGIIEAFDSFVEADELKAAKTQMLPAANRLGEYDSRTYAIANGLDIRALLYNKTFLDSEGYQVPETLEEFNAICEKISAPGNEARERYAYLPDSRRLWSWAYVFGGKFIDDQSGEAELSGDAVLAAARWMQSFGDKYGSDNVAAFRQGDQSLPGKTFPLLPINDEDAYGRYVFILAGQWNTRDVGEFQKARKKKGIPFPEFGVCPLPYPSGGRPNAGWVNGNVFVVPKGAANKPGAWEFVKFWIGIENAKAAAKTCAAGGWIPVTTNVLETREFQTHLKSNPLFGRYVELAQSENQFTYPLVPAAPFFVRTLNAVNESLMADPQKDVEEELAKAERKIRRQLKQVREQYQ